MDEKHITQEMRNLEEVSSELLKAVEVLEARIHTFLLHTPVEDGLKGENTVDECCPFASGLQAIHTRLRHVLGYINDIVSRVDL